ncbi:unnamed protein product [Adineta steineri]|uniref:Uncharacterized protein n=1 Tax=Adineta steineri TaxID=433720 RepID=A0A815T4T4_9BILA|nr:unnamed protein product [Adineta steineri]CAF3802443.1 unnamed protein product [Adineta steineri]
MALVFQRNEVEFERTGVKGNIPNNDVAYLMYYLQCVCTSINCNNDPDIQRFTNYNNWSSLSTDEQRALVVVCYAFSPDVLADRVFFHSDTLCGERANEFYTINQVRNQLVAAESIITAGRVRVVNQIMTYKVGWMHIYYIGPMQRLLARLNTSSQRPAFSHTPTYTAPVIRQRTTTKTYNMRGLILTIIFILITIIILFIIFMH